VVLRRKIQRKEKETGSHEGLTVSEVKKRIHPVEETIGKISGLVYGRSGTGKTTFASSLLELPDFYTDRDKVLLLDMREEGTDSVYDQKGIEVINVSDWRDVEGAYWYLKESDHPYKGLIIDTVTQLQFLAMDEAKRRAKKGKEEAMNKLSWGYLSSMLGPMLLDIRDLPMHSCILAQDRREKIEEGDEESEDLLPEMGPAVMPSVSKSLTAMVKFIGQTYIQQKQKPTKKGIRHVTEFRMRIGPHPFYLTKVRTPRYNVVPKSIKDPSFLKVVKAMRGEYGQKTEV